MFAPVCASRIVFQLGKISARCFSRRRCTEEGIRIASRYFATVRRAMSMPLARIASALLLALLLSGLYKLRAGFELWLGTACTERAAFRQLLEAERRKPTPPTEIERAHSGLRAVDRDDPRLLYYNRRTGVARHGDF